MHVFNNQSTTICQLATNDNWQLLQARAGSVQALRPCGLVFIYSKALRPCGPRAVERKCPV